MKADQRPPSWLKGLLVGFLLFGTTLAISTVPAVIWVMEGFRADLIDQALAQNDLARMAAIEAAVVKERMVMTGVLAALVAVATLNIASSFWLLTKHRQI